jgi:hypothetical protein
LIPNFPPIALAKGTWEYIMDSMFGDKKNLKDIKDTNPTLRPPLSGEGWERLSYTKTDKLITALYMVTDIIDKDEPLRNKLRTSGTGIISDINSDPAQACLKISEIMSFLGIASAMNIVSEMNCNILRKEFIELDQALKEFAGKPLNTAQKIDLTDFFEASPLPVRESNSKGHVNLGIQKAGTLLKAIKDVSDIHPAQNFDALKKQRREDIVNVIKIIGGSATIKDIKTKAKTLPAKAGSLATCGEKTLQRELVSMVHDGVLKKTGEKRWSRYLVM